MNSKSKYLMDLIFKKLNKNSSRKINLDKEEINEFINFLIKDT